MFYRNRSLCYFLSILEETCGACLRPQRSTKQLLLFNSRLLRILAKCTTLNLVTWEISNTYIRFWFQFKVHIEDRASNFFQGMNIYIHKNVLFAQIPYCEFSYDLNDCIFQKGHCIHSMSTKGHIILPDISYIGIEPPNKRILMYTCMSLSFIRSC